MAEGIPAAGHIPPAPGPSYQQLQVPIVKTSVEAVSKADVFLEVNVKYEAKDTEPGRRRL